MPSARCAHADHRSGGSGPRRCSTMTTWRQASSLPAPGSGSQICFAPPPPVPRACRTGGSIDHLALLVALSWTLCVGSSERARSSTTRRSRPPSQPRGTAARQRQSRRDDLLHHCDLTSRVSVLLSPASSLPSKQPRCRRISSIWGASSTVVVSRPLTSQLQPGADILGRSGSTTPTGEVLHHHHWSVSLAVRARAPPPRDRATGDDPYVVGSGAAAAGPPLSLPPRAWATENGLCVAGSGQILSLPTHLW